MHDLHIIGDVVVASLITSAARLAIVKGIVEPVAAAAGRRGWSWLDRVLGDRLPNLPQ
ncbi:MAG: hypothetical protein VKM92_00265 [Cyanobacteriota bacterium]|nr:hypothetical protein [Cyanobacteriota bacterium]